MGGPSQRATGRTDCPATRETGRPSRQRARGLRAGDWHLDFAVSGSGDSGGIRLRLSSRACPQTASSDGLLSAAADDAVGPSRPAAKAKMDSLYVSQSKKNAQREGAVIVFEDRKSTRLNSSHGYISYAVFCLKKKKTQRALQEDTAPAVSAAH